MIPDPFFPIIHTTTLAYNLPTQQRGGSVHSIIDFFLFKSLIHDMLCTETSTCSFPSNNSTLTCCVGAAWPTSSGFGRAIASSIQNRTIIPVSMIVVGR